METSDNDTEKGDVQHCCEHDTCHRILDVAEVVFAEKGYTKTSVREITEKAGCNVAAINYHFGGKENLYRQVFKRYFSQLRDRRLGQIELFRQGKKGDMSLETLLKVFAAVFVEPMVTKESRHVLLKLMMREMEDPFIDRDEFFHDVIDPVLCSLGKTLVDILPGLNEEHARFCVMSFIGQLMHVARAKHFSDDSKAIKEKYGDLDLDEMLGYVVQFTAAGIRQFVNKE